MHDNRAMALRFLVTAGPTREPVDDVRFLSNRSTGVMGFAVAEAALAAGHAVTLVAGPVALEAPAGATLVAVETALQMRDAVAAALPSSDVLVMAAAVADYRPAERIAGKRKKDGGDWVLKLARNPDILAEAAAAKGRRVHVGFAVESDDLVANAKKKLEAKNLDLIVANGVSAFGGARSSVVLLAPGRAPERIDDAPKARTAARIVAFCEDAARARIAGEGAREPGA